MNRHYEPHLYLICYPNSALVLSQLSPERFGTKYSYGSATYYTGKLIFAEVDIDYRDPYFDIDRALETLRPHDDQSPKATLYVSCYRVLEHIAIDAIKTVYLANADGSCYALLPGQYEPPATPGGLHVYAELTPLRTLVLSTLDLRAFGAYLTSGTHRLSVPRLMYLEMALDIDGFEDTFEANPFAPPPLAGVHPSKIINAIRELRARPDKTMKALTLDTSFNTESYHKIAPGLMIKDAFKERYFPMPDVAEIEAKNYRFYKRM